MTVCAESYRGALREKRVAWQYSARDLEHLTTCHAVRCLRSVLLYTIRQCDSRVSVSVST